MTSRIGGRRLRHLVQRRARKGVGERRTYVALEHFDGGLGRLRADADLQEKAADDAVLFEAGDVLFGKLRPYLAKSMRVTDPGACSGELVVMTPRPGLDSKYLALLVQSHPFISWAVATSEGVKMPRTSWEALGDIRLPVPEISAQRSIAERAEQTVSRLDQLADAVDRLIALVAHRKQRLISRVVTQGYGAPEPSKDHHLPGLEAVPAHWNVSRLKRLVPRITVGIVVQPAQWYVPIGVPALRGLNVKAGRIVTDDLVHITDEGHRVHSKSTLRQGDLVVVRTGQAGAAAVVPEWLDGANCIDVLVVRRGTDLRPRFLEYVVNSDFAVSQIERGSVGSLQAHFNVSAMRRLVVPVPPVEEQDGIVTFLDAETTRLDRLSALLRREAALIAERRRSYLTAAIPSCPPFVGANP